MCVYTHKANAAVHQKCARAKKNKKKMENVKETRGKTNQDTLKVFAESRKAVAGWLRFFSAFKGNHVAT